MRKVILTAMMALTAIPLAPVGAQGMRELAGIERDGDRDRHRGRDRDDRRYDRDGRQGEWRAERNYREGRKYRERRLGRNERIYRGNDGRYYCKRNDGTTGLIVGALGGGVLGNLIAPGGSKTLGTVLGGAGGALLGKSLDDGVRCR